MQKKMKIHDMPVGTRFKLHEDSLNEYVIVEIPRWYITDVLKNSTFIMNTKFYYVDYVKENDTSEGIIQ